MWPFKQDRQQEERSSNANAQTMESIANISQFADPTSNGNVFAVTSFISKQGSGYKFETASKDLGRLLNLSPDKKISANDYWSAIYMQLLTYGNAYSKLSFNRAGEVEKIEFIENCYPYIITNQNGIKEIKHYLLDGRIVQNHYILHFKMNSMDGLIGRSPLFTCKKYMQGIQAVEMWNSDLFENAERPSGFYSLDGEFNNEEAVQRFKDSVNEAKNGKSLVLTNGIKYQPLSMNSVDLDFINQQHFSVQQVCRLFSLDPQFLAESESATSYASQKEASKSLYSRTILPLLEIVQSELKLKTMSEISINNQELSRLGALDRANYYKLLLDGGAITPEKIAELEGF